MARTIQEVKRDIQAEYDMIRVIRSDVDRDVLPVEREHRAAIDRLGSKLERLRHKRLHGRALLEQYELRVAELRAEYEVLRNQDLIKRLADLVDKIKSAGGTVELNVDPVLEFVSTTRERMADVRAMIRGYDGETKVTKKALSGSFEQEEARLEAAIEKRKTQFAAFLEHKADSWGCEKRCHDRVRRLRGELETVKKTGKVRQLEDTMSEIETLMAELGDEKLAYVMSMLD